MSEQPKPPQAEGLDYTDPVIQEEILIRQRRDMWSPEQVASLSGHFRLRPGQAFLDAGCGFAYSLRTFGPSCLPGGRLVGIDRQGDLLTTAARLCGEEGIGDATEFVTGDLHELPFENDSFDVVMIQVVMCHLTDPEAVLDELIRVAKPGGCIAVFDNAVGGCPWGWDNTYDGTVEEMTQRCEDEIRAHAGRKQLGRGDWSVGLYVPAWMEERGLRDVDARVNEKVQWIAPPYRSPAQQVSLTNTRESAEDPAFFAVVLQDMAVEMRAAGADDAAITRAVDAARERDRRWRTAVADGSAAFAYGGSFWCIWGFKP